MPPSTSYGAMPNPYYTSASPPPPQPNQHDRSYTLGGDGYGASSVPPLQEYNTPAPYGYGAPAHTQSPPPISTDVSYLQSPPQTSPVRGPRAQPGTVPEDSPPGYDAGTSGVTGNWGKR